MTEIDEQWWTRVLAGPDGNLHESVSTERYIALPRASDPRIVVDSDDPQALRDAVDRFVANRGSLGRLPLSSGAAALLSRRRPTWLVGSPGSSLREHLSDVLDAEVRLSVAVGPPRPNLKPVVRCYAKSTLVAVAKLGPDPHTAALVENEARWLDALVWQPLNDVRTPTLLHQGTYGGSALLVMSALDLQHDRSVDLSEVPIDVTTELNERFGDTSDVVDGAWFCDLRRRLDRADLLAEAAQLRDVEANPLLTSVAVTAWHGDWSPWNVGHHRDGSLCIWDWERAGVGVPLGFDQVHLHYQYGEGTAAAADDLITLGVPPEQHDLIATLYLLELSARHGEASALDSPRHVRVRQELSRVRERSRS